MHHAAALAPLVSTALLLAPAFAQSDAALDRLESASEAVSRNMEVFMLSRAPDLAEVMPAIDWDEDYREVGRCTLGGLQARGGDSLVEQYLTAIEAWAEVEVTSLAQMSLEAPEVLSNQTATELMQDCGAAELATERMAASGLLEAMMRPDVIGALME
jgi:hypothetical protein